MVSDQHVIQSQDFKWEQGVWRRELLKVRLCLKMDLSLEYLRLIMTKLNRILAD